MSDGLATTLGVLSKTDNESAVRLLLPALDSPNLEIQEGALNALLNRRNPAGQSEILRRIPSLSQSWKHIIGQQPWRLTGTMRIAVLGTDETQFANACAAAVMFDDYDLIPTLLTVLGDVPDSKAGMAIETLMKLVSRLSDELAHGNEHSKHRDPRMIQQHIVSCLEASVQRFGRHRRREIIEAFLMLVNSNNSLLNDILENPHHAGYIVICDIMARTSHDVIMKLLLDYLENPQAPSIVFSMIANRCDLNFIRAFLHTIGRDPAAPVCQSLKRMAIIAWLRNLKNIIEYMDEAAQQSLIKLVTAAGITRSQVYSAIECVLLHGKTIPRREAALALADFSGSDSNKLALRALKEDADPQVQANIILQLRHRGIPGVLSQLAELLNSPHLSVRQAARDALSEISFTRYVTNFDMLDDETRISTANLVKKIDLQTIPLLRAELQSPIRNKRLRGMKITRVMDVTSSVEDLVIGLLRDEDHILRTEAAEMLAKCHSPAARAALEEALHDKSVIVQETAQRSLDELLS
jgi:HEAT repeat protein